MITTRAADAVLVTFSISDIEDASMQISVVGDFNDWDPHATAMEPGARGHSVTVCLQPGHRYRFRYLTEDGRWFNDAAADDYEPNTYGGLDGAVDLTKLS